MSLLKFEFVAQARLRLPSFFPFLLMVVREKDYMKLDAGKVIDNMTQGSCLPIDSVKSSDDYSSLDHSIGTGPCIDSNKTNPAHLVLSLIHI